MILTVGCSYTYGQGLDNPEAHAWPRPLSTRLGIPLTNHSIIGASNDYIYRTVIEATADRSWDLVIVQWSEISRYEFYNWVDPTKPKGPVQISVQQSSGDTAYNKWVKHLYTDQYHDELRIQQFFCQVLGLQSWLKTRNQRYLFLSMNGFLRHDLAVFEPALKPLTAQLDQSCILGWPDTGMSLWSKHHLLPCRHPTVQGHEIIAEKIYEHIGNLGWLS